MRFLILGAGLMGPAAAYNALLDPEVGLVTLADRDPAQLESAREHLERVAPDASKLRTVIVELANRSETSDLMRDHDVVLGALPWSASVLALDAALDVRVPFVDLAIPADDDLPPLRARVADAGSLVVLGAGLEPGLTEIWARHLALGLDAVDELHIKVGGVPEVPSGPLGYRIVFGGREMPLREADALVVHECRPQLAARYSEAEPVDFPGIGRLEAWHEGVLPWILDLPEFKAMHAASQKTIRWPGYAERITTLKEMGLLSTLPIEVGGVMVSPKAVVDAVLYPHVRLRDGEGDITLFRVDVVGRKEGSTVARRADMVDRIDRERGFTSMARTTAFTGAIISRMIGRGEITATGVITTELVITGALFERLVVELAKEGVVFLVTEE
jgi:lysine 6-dehydrogenase